MARLFSFVCLVLALVACRDGEPTAATSSPAPSAPPAAASADAMCKEHGVLEAVCTKCNPALIAVFKAKGERIGLQAMPLECGVEQFGLRGGAP